MNAFLAVARLPWVQRRNQGAMWPLWMLIALPVVSLAAALGTNGLRRPLALLATTGSMMTLDLLWSILVVPTLMAQSSPANARLVPGLHRRVILVAALEWLVLVALHGVVLGLALGHPIQLAVVGGLYSLGLCWALRFPFAPFLVVVVPIAVPGVLPLLQRTGFVAGTPLALAAGVALTAVAGLLTLRGLMPEGGDAHLRLWERMRARGPSRRWQTGEPTPTSGWRILHLGYLMGLRRECARSGPAARLLPFALGPDGHWMSLVPGFVGLGAAAVATFLLVVAMSPGSGGLKDEFAGGMAALILAGYPAAHLAAVRLNMWQRRREQALVSLAPGAHPAAMNASLARALVVPLLVVSLAGLVASLLLGLLLPAALPAARRLVEVQLVILPLAGLTLDDYARMRSPSLSRGLAVVLSVAALVAGLAAVEEWVHEVPLPAVALVSVSATAVFVTRRWRRMLASPTAFPAGRLAP